MVDIPGNSTTTRSILVGGSISDTLETTGDHDWIRIQLTAGQSISVSVDGLTLEDPYLRIFDSNGNLLFQNDDISSGSNRDSLLAFTANYTGTYYIDVAAWEPEPGQVPPGYTGTGTYTLSVSTYTPPPLGTVEQLADYLATGNWGGEERHFNVTPGGSITVNLTALAAPAQTLALAALATWTDIIGITFVQVSQGGQITFDDSQAGAFSTSMVSNGIITSSHVNVSTQWLDDYGTHTNSYSFQTFIHEIGHALGLGHQGGYNGEARYPFDAVFQNDGWPLSVMSYFDQQDNTYFAGQGFDINFITTPMMADILAMSMLYGLSTTTRVGDSAYGAGWTNTMGALCIFDSGGIDTINVSGLGGSHRIDLRPGTFSNVLGEVGNVSIALGVIIENAIGASGGDILIGNDVANILTGNAGLDTLIGGAGNDTFQDTAAGLNGDTITDFAGGDKIVISNASLAGFTFSLSGSTLTYTGGALTLTGFAGQLQASAAQGGGVQLTVAVATDARNDFDGDGCSDLLWRNDAGTLSEWTGHTSGGFAWNPFGGFDVATSWKIVGTGDFNGDGRDDLIWRQDGTGKVMEWLGQQNGGFAWNTEFDLATSFQLEGVGDFNGDGFDDLLWRDGSGTLSEWLGQPNGGFEWNPFGAFNVVTSWGVIGTGDFNGDGRDDLIWRQEGTGKVMEWLGQQNGGFAWNVDYALDTSWHIQPDMPSL